MFGTITEYLINSLMGPTTFNAPGGFHIEGSFTFVIAALAGLAGVFIFSLVWLYGDAKARDKNPFVAMLFVLLIGWPASFIWWFWLRPPLKDRNPEVQAGFALQPVPSHSHI